MDGSSIIPFDTASGVGYVNSTENAKLKGVKGIAPKPSKAKFAVRRPTFLLGKVNSTPDINAIDANDIIINVSLNLCVLSSMMPVQIEPKIPEMIKTPPKSELS